MICRGENSGKPSTPNDTLEVRLEAGGDLVGLRRVDGEPLRPHRLVASERQPDGVIHRETGRGRRGRLRPGRHRESQHDDEGRKWLLPSTSIPRRWRIICVMPSGQNLKSPLALTNLFSNLSERYDVIAWNPPYLPGSPRDLAEAAFFGGPQYEVIHRFAKEAGAYLKPGGQVYTIVSTDADVDYIRGLFRNNGLSFSETVASQGWIWANAC